MYCDFYQLTERPFNVTPDPKFLYLNARYREAIASLNYGITQRKGFVTLIGEAGTGKTTLLKKLLEDLDTKTKSVFIFNTNVTFEEILEYIFAEFDLPVHNGKKLYMLQRLNTFLLEELRGGGNVALLIDEAQDLEFSVLEDLRLLSNLETAKEKILQIVLSGQPELGQKLSNPVLRQLRQRIGINCRLLPLSRDEITEYIRFRLQAAGCQDLKLFSREAEDQIYHFSRGIPRLVNVVCDNALVIGYALGKKRIGADVITEAAADLLSVEPSVAEVRERPVAVAAPAPPPEVASPARWRPRFGMASVVAVAMIVGLLSVGRTMLHKRSDDVPPLPPATTRLEVIRPGSQAQGTGVDAPVVPSGRGAGSEPAAADETRTGDVSEPPTGRLAARQPEARPPDAPAPKVPLAVDPSVPRVPPALDAGRLVRTEADRPAAVPQPRERRSTAEEPSIAPPADDRPAAAWAPEQKAPAAEAMPPAPVKPAPREEPKATAKSEVAMRPADEPVTKAWQARDVARHPQGLESQSDTLPEAGPAAPLESGPHLDGVQFGKLVVRGGDSMSGIAQRKYGQASYTILDLLMLANPELKNIDVISVGQTIRLPELSEGFPVLNDGSGHYALLVYSTPSPNRAGNLQKALRGRGFDARVSGGNIGAQKPVFRVVVSGFADRDEGVTVGKQLQKLFREDNRIAQLGE